MVLGDNGGPRAGEDEPELGFEVPEADAAEQAQLAEPDDDEVDEPSGPLPDEADPADVAEQRTGVPRDDEDDGR
jgi:hypothetical protein